ncbi:glycine cleavage system protein R [Desulforhopalus singaporensis]|uniref:Glycine cleavage system transcriptional repressor n=1 Tax=Desulforhopalus singaporensis TaxID=91360 RepID=A0A1H0JV17_9BACT|nr:ACT domain-containing protein [Desulforhopalus singaporensis]SDO47420.1 glycine cleavage system transcriptional repressor [Desulforhopalus singaporensis]
MEKQMIVSVMSKDRPGIIAGITGAIFRLGGDVADLNQTVLCGYLTMILSVSFEPSTTKEDVLAAISHIKTESKFEVSIKELTEGELAEAVLPPEETYILTVQGPNRGGIVHGISLFCYERNINILDLATTLEADQYTMALQLDLKNCTCSLEVLREELEKHASSSGLTIMMQHNDIFQVTNEVTLH